MLKFLTYIHDDTIESTLHRVWLAEQDTLNQANEVTLHRLTIMGDSAVLLRILLVGTSVNMHTSMPIIMAVLKDFELMQWQQS